MQYNTISKKTHTRHYDYALWQHITLPGFECDLEDSDMDPVDITKELAYLPPHRISCFAHTLQLVLKVGLKDLGLDEGSFGGSTHLQIYSSNRAARGFAESQKLKTANKTRWKSQLKMVWCVLHIPKEMLDELNARLVVDIWAQCAAGTVWNSRLMQG